MNQSNYYIKLKWDRKVPSFLFWRRLAAKSVYLVSKQSQYYISHRYIRSERSIRRVMSINARKPDVRFYYSYHFTFNAYYLRNYQKCIVMQGVEFKISKFLIRLKEDYIFSILLHQKLIWCVPICWCSYILSSNMIL